MHVGSTNTRAIHMDQHVINSDLRLGHLLEPKPWFAFFLHKCFHKLKPIAWFYFIGTLSSK